MLAQNITENTTSLRNFAVLYNTLAAEHDRPTVKRFSSKVDAALRLRRLCRDCNVQEVAVGVSPATPEVTAEPPHTEVAVELVEDITDTPGVRRVRQMCFNYPPNGNDLITLKEGSLRAKALEVLRKGATFSDIEAVVVSYDKLLGKPGDRRIRARAYGLIRLLHTWAGYALREEDRPGQEKLIWAMTPEEWKSRHA